MTKPMEGDGATPRPWRKSGDVVLGNNNEIVATCGNDFCETPYEKDKANAELIVRAVNAHEDLVKALKNARASLIAFGGDPRGKCIIGEDVIQVALLDEIDAALSTNSKDGN
jgi:hypothetical protein